MKSDPFGHIAVARFYLKHAKTPESKARIEARIQEMEQWDMDYARATKQQSPIWIKKQHDTRE